MAFTTVKVILDGFFQDAGSLCGKFQMRLAAPEFVDAENSIVAPIVWQSVSFYGGNAALSVIPNSQIGTGSYYKWQIYQCAGGQDKLIASGDCVVPDYDCQLIDITDITPTPETATTAAAYASEAKAAAVAAAESAGQAASAAQEIVDDAIADLNNQVVHLAGVETVTGIKTFTNGINADVTGSLKGNVTGNVTGDLEGDVTGNVTGSLAGNADTASKLQTAQSLKVALASETPVTFDGSAAQDAIPVSGVLPVSHGGTGVTAIADVQAGKDAEGNTIASTYAKDADLATVAKTGMYADLSGKPVIDSALSASSNNAVTNAAITTGINAAQATADEAKALGGAAYKYKGSVATISALPSSGNAVGDVYDVQETGMNYAWNGTQWDQLGQLITVDSTITQGGSNPVTGGAIYTALAGKANTDDIPAASTVVPQPLGTAATGASNAYARADHVHKLPDEIASNTASISALQTAVSGNTQAIAGHDDAIEALEDSISCNFSNSTAAATTLSSTVPSGVNAYAEINSIGGASAIVDGTIVNAEVTQVVSKTSANAIVDTRSIPRAVLALPDYGAGVGTAVNVLHLDTLQYTWAAATIDLGNIEWKLGSGWGDGGFYSDSIPARVKHVANNDTVANILCAAYPTSTRNRVQTSEPTALGIAVDTAGNICIRDTNYTTAAEITAALKGVILLFELATPVTQDVSDILPKSNIIKVAAGGSLTFDNEAGLAVPVSVTYQSGEWGLENCLDGATASLPDRDEMNVLYKQHEANTEAIASHTSVLGILAKKDYAMFADWNEIAEIVRGGDAARVFSIGDQLNVPWQSGGATKHDYSVPLDIVSFRDVELEDGSIVPGMILQWHYTTGPESMPFDQTEALYYCEEELPTGTYHVTAAVNWGSHGITAGKSFQFTTTQAVPAGGQVVFSTAMADTDIANWKAYTYASGSSITAIETIASITEGSAGTYLGSWALNTSALSESPVNQMQRSGYGYNRWAQSLYRQWLNTDAAAGAWYVQQNRFDRISAECNAQRGFMAGYNSDFLSVLKPVKIVTALNTVTDSAIGTTETTYDTFWLPSIEEMYFVPQLAGVEGEAWEYWKERVDMPQPYPTGKINRVYIPYGIDATTTSRGARLRSASRGGASHAWSVHYTGYASSGNAYSAYRCAPACTIC